jgi:DNA polymerase-4
MSASNFTSAVKSKTFSLFEAEEDNKSRRLSEQVTKLRDKYGVDILRCAVEKTDARE